MKNEFFESCSVIPFASSCNFNLPVLFAIRTVGSDMQSSLIRASSRLFCFIPKHRQIRGQLFSNRSMSVRVDTISVANVKIPQIGIGSWQANDDELERAIELALEAGYRHIDTAYVYENEKVIGRVLKRWMDSGKLKREDLFIVTKLPPSGNRPSTVNKYLKGSLENLQLDYVDLYLVHTPFAFQEVEGDLHPTKDGKILLDKTTDHVAVWKEMEKQVQSGLTKSIGLSNFNVKQITRVLENATIRPVNLQVELHAYLQQKDLVAFCKKNNITVTAYSPLGSPGLSKFIEKFGKKVELPVVLQDEVVKTIAKKHNKTPAQILLRHLIQNGLIAIPKSTNAERLRQNIDIFGFTLDGDDVNKLNALDRGEDGRLVNFLLFDGIKEHPEYPF